MSRFSPLAVLTLSATLLMLGVGMIVALLPQRVYATTGTLESVGLVAAVFALAYLLAQLPVAILSDRLGARPFLVTGYLLCALSGVVFVTTETAAGIYLGRAIQGLGEAPVWALGPAVLAAAYPEARGRAIGIYNAAIHIGLAAGPLLGLLVAPDGQGRQPFVLFAVLCLVAGALVMLFPGAVPAASSAVGRGGTGARQFLSLLRAKTAVVLLAGVLLYGAGYGVFISVLPVSLVRTHDFGTVGISLHFVLFYATVSLAQVGAGLLSDRIGRHGFMVWGMALAAAGMASLPLVPGAWVYLPLGLAGIGLGVFCVVSMAELTGSVPDTLKGAVSGSYYFFWAAGCMLGPLAVGAAAAGSPFLGFVFLAGLFALQAIAVRIVAG
ncbi:MFS transporter [Stappia sp. MMSF_3263]|uniref:MFS transporter n=1 Tax=Stappia sp. MMSF_3263 TaxID=3046693 RepID=UPI00273DE55E|nr:MFS transporter [Stappia sp. MMSF_3263]